MAVARTWRDGSELDGPLPITAADFAALNQVFSDAFTDRYRRDGMMGVRVPYLSHAVWRYAIEDAEGGAMLWRSQRGELAAFNIAHISGSEGWMGPLAVAGAWQGAGVGKLIVQTAVDWLVERGARTIGLETMPRTMDNIGFYSRLGFDPGHLTLTVSVEAPAAVSPPVLLGRLRAREREARMAECTRLLHSLLPGPDFTREMSLTYQLALGDTVLIEEDGELAGFAICHTAPLVEGRSRDEIRVMKLACRSGRPLEQLVDAISAYARASGSRRTSIRVQTGYLALYRRLLAVGGRVRWSDLRMTAAGYPEPRSTEGVVLSNWEI